MVTERGSTGSRLGRQMAGQTLPHNAFLISDLLHHNTAPRLHHNADLTLIVCGSRSSPLHHAQSLDPCSIMAIIKRAQQIFHQTVDTNRRKIESCPPVREPFRFFELPKDMRFLVYDTISPGRELRCNRETMRSLMAFACINQFLRAEMTSFLIQQHTFVIAASSLQSFHRRLPDLLYQNIRCLRVEGFPDIAGHYLLGIPLVNYLPIPYTDGRSLTEAFPALRHLSIQMPTQNDGRFPAPGVNLRFMSDLTVADLLQHVSVQWLLRCRGLESFRIVGLRFLDMTREEFETIPLAFFRTLGPAMEELGRYIEARVR